jgi:hypothetical protein
MKPKPQDRVSFEFQDIELVLRREAARKCLTDGPILALLSAIKATFDQDIEPLNEFPMNPPDFWEQDIEEGDLDEN